MFRLALLVPLAVSVYSLSCPCWRELDKTKYCPLPPENCPLGVTTDPCGCCLECYKVSGERCGGPWRVYGVCGEGLKCEKGIASYENEYMYELHREGVCTAT